MADSPRTTLRGPGAGDLEARFWAKVDRRGPGECWPWIGARNIRGYGRIHVPGRRSPALAHRVSLALDGRDPGTLYGIHLCDNPGCVNPAHLEVAGQSENMRQMVARGRATQVGSSHQHAKLSRQDVFAIRSSSEPAAVLAGRYGVGRRHVRKVRAGSSRRHG